MAAAAHEMWSRAAWAVLALGATIDVPASTLLAGLSFDEAELRKRKRISWEEYCGIIDRLAVAAGGPRELEDLLAGTYHEMWPELRVIAGSILSPKLLYRFTLDILDAIMFPPVVCGYEDLGGDRIRARCELRPGVKPCEAFFIGTTGALRSVPCHLGLPRAEILSAELDDTHGIWELRVPPSRTLARRASQLVARFVLGADPDGTLVTVTIGAGDGGPKPASLDDAIAAWKLTPRQADVLELVVAGKANKEIANALDCADNTVELHVTRLLRKANVTSRGQLIAAFWSQTWGSPP